MSKKKKFYITTAIDYASGAPHIGHAYEKIAGDVLARWNRNLGREVFFQTGMDEHGQKIKDKAKEIKKEPQEFVDLIAKQFENLIKKLNISSDSFIRTTNEKHKKIVQKIIQKSFDRGDIYKGNYEGLYCVGCEKYYTEEELVDGKICPDHKKEVEFKKEENYFFALSKYQKKLLDFYEKNPNFISPKSKQKEILNRVKEGLNDISISRDKKNLTWGVELPFDKTHVIYVWFDALFNYYSGTKIEKKENFWPADIQIIGHDISWFHIVYWPAFLMSVGIDIPKKIFSHGMILDEKGHKMSKSLGNVIDPIKFSKEYGLDELRYFLITAISFGDDLNFSLEKFAEKVNNELNNDLGNLVSRIHTMTNKYFNGIVPEVLEFTTDDEEYLSKLNIFDEFDKNMQKLKFNQAFEILWTSIRECNAYINKVAPWKEQDKKRLKTIISILVSSIKMFAEYFDCIMPEKAEKLRKQYNFKKDNNFKFQIVKKGHKIGEKENLFEKIILEKNTEISVTKYRNNTDRIQNLEKNKIKNIIFDFDGVIHNTILDMHKVHCETLKECSFKDWKRDVFEKNARDCLDSFPENNKKDFLNSWEKIYDDLKLEKNIKKELEKLYKNYNLYIVSSNSEKNLNMYFENNNFTKIFKEILGAETHNSKEEKFKILFKKYNINNKDSIFITDTLGDILEANEVELKTIAVDFGAHNKEDLQKGNPFKIISKFKEIRKTIDSLNLPPTSNFQPQKPLCGFSSLNLKVGKILSVKQHPEAEKLYIEEIDLGEEKPRTIVSGLTNYYKIDEMIGKKVVVLCNLKPAKLRGVKSEGMVLVSEDEKNKKLGLLLSESNVGINLECNNEIAESSSRIKIDDFFKMDFKSDGEKVYFEGQEVGGKRLEVKIDRKVKGIVC